MHEIRATNNNRQMQDGCRVIVSINGITNGHLERREGNKGVTELAIIIILKCIYKNKLLCFTRAKIIFPV